MKTPCNYSSRSPAPALPVLRIGKAAGRQAYFLLLCFYGCFALGALYWTLYLLLFGATPRVFYVSEFGWVASVIFLHILPVLLMAAGRLRAPDPA